jgi:hypothetical protein
MTSVAQPTAESHTDVRTIVGGGLKLGVATVVGVVAFVLLSHWLAGRAEVVVQSLLVLLGGAVFSYAPAYWVRPREVDTIAWASLLGLLGSVVFTVVDTAILRPVHLYPWTWDAIGGGSGFWYIPVWWMGSCFLAWLGSWVYSIRAAGGGTAVGGSLQTVGLGVLIFVILAATGLAPFHSAVAGLAFTLALVLHVPLAAVLRPK